MSHPDEGTLTALLDGALEAEERRLAETHLKACGECQRRYDDIRAFQVEADRLLVAVDLPPASPGGQPRGAAPGSGTRWWPLASAATLLLAVGLARMADRPHPTDPVSAGSDVGPARAATADSAKVGFQIREVPRATETSRPAQANRAPTAAAAAPPLAPAAEQKETQSGVAAAEVPAAAEFRNAERAAVEDARARGEGLRRRTEMAPTPSADAGRIFHPVTLEEAVRLLGGAVRLVDGLAPREVLTAPGSLVSGADPAAPVVRVVYEDPPSRQLWLDQQRTPTGAREDVLAEAPVTADRTMGALAALLPGDTLMTVGPAAGSHQLRWVTPEGFRLQLTGYLPADSLRQLMRRIR